MERRAELKDQREVRHRQRRQERYGKTAAGNYVDLELVDTLCGMRFEKKLSIAALRQTENALERSVELLTTQPDMLLSRKEVVAREIESMGIANARVALDAVQRCGGDRDAAIAALLDDSFGACLPEAVPDSHEFDELPADESPHMESPEQQAKRHKQG